MKSNKSNFYTLSFPEDKRDEEGLKVHRDVMAYFRTLQNMLSDFENDSNIPIPMMLPISRDVMQWIVDAYTILESVGEASPMLENAMSFDDLYALLVQYNRFRQLQETDSAPLLTLFDRGEDDLLPKDIPLLISIINALNVLEARRLLFITIDKLKDIIKGMSNTELRSSITSNKRRETETSKGLPETPYYEREGLIQNFLASMGLITDLITAKLDVKRYITPMCTSFNFQLFLTPSGLYGMGDNTSGQLGLKSSILELIGITKLQGPPGKPLLISCGGAFSICLTSEGLFSTGSNKHGQLGLGEPVDPEQGVFGWTKMSVDGDVLLIETGLYSTFVLTTSGLYSCGLKQDPSTSEDSGVLQLVRTLQTPIIDIDTYQLQSIVQTLDNNGQVNVELLFPDLDVDPTLFSTSKEIGTILSTATGTSHAMILSKTGLYAYGENTRGQLGNKFVGGDVPTHITTFTGTPLAVYAAGNYTILLTTDGLFGTGKNKWGQLSIGVAQGDDVETFQKMEGLEEAGLIKAVSCSATTVMVLTEFGLYAVGYVGNLPLVVPLEEDENTLTRFRKVNLDLGYRWLIEFLDDEDGPQRKQRRLDCLYCRGEARFISSHQNEQTPFCSKYCLFKAQLKNQ